MSTDKMLTKQEILNADDRKIQDVPVPEWGGTVRLVSLTGAERDDFEAAIAARRGKGDKLDIKGLKVLLVSMCIVDGVGERMFTEADVEALNNKAAKPLNDLYAVAQKMNGIGEDEAKELVGNSSGDQTEQDGSGSPEQSADAQ